MIKSLLFIFIIMMAFPYNGIAQMEKGSWMLRGKFGLNYERNNTDIISTNPNYPNQPDIVESIPSIEISPGIGYFVSKNLAIGIEGRYGRSRGRFSNSFSETTKLISNTFGIGLFVRKYVPLDDKISFYIEANGGRDWEKPVGKNEAGEKFNTIKSNSVRLNGIWGFQYLITKNIGLDVYSNLIQYTSRNTIDLLRDEKIANENQLSLNLNSHFGIGLNVFF